MLSRINILKYLIILCFIIIVFRLFLVMFIEHEVYLQKANMQHVKKEEIIPKRGNIYDRTGRDLAISLERDSLFIDPVLIKDNETINILKNYVKNIDYNEIMNDAENNKRFVWIKRKLDDDTAKKIKELKLQGLGFVTEHIRYYPKGSIASHVIGFVNTDEEGIEGLEKYYNNYLKAQKTSKVVLRDATGKKLSDGNYWEIRGNDVVLTLDEGLQYIVEKHLDEAMNKWQASSATVIMMEPFTGEILALANRPNYNPNDLKTIKSLSVIRNRSITDLYEPGSTFKIITASAALEEKIIKTNTKIDCAPGFIEVGGKKIKDVHKYGVLSFEEIIQKSSNVGTIKIAMMLGREKLYEYIKKFGIGEKTGIDLPGEVAGHIKPINKWSGTSIGAIPIGQEVAVTALQMLRAYSAIANGGYLVKPFIVSEIRSPEGNIVYKAVIQRNRVLSEKTAYTLREILKKVTQEGGTATTARVEGNNVAGKTGTAQKYDPKIKQYSKDKFVSSFVGFIPAENPRIACIIVIHDPKGAHYGGVVASPVFKAISDEALAYLNVPRDDAKEKGLVVTINNNEANRKVVASR
ncbi:MAG: penicillin-binding protein 2 [Thermodesulfovibrio sp.]|nr:penicillin-binding protein 2 [Thermodesulfovibrio sp.]